SQLRRPLASSAKLPLPPSWPVSVDPAAYPWDTGPTTPFGLPPEKPPPPTPSNRPFQPDMGSPMNTRMRSPADGWETTAVTRQNAGRAPLAGSIAADSMVVFASVMVDRLSHVRSGCAGADAASASDAQISR